MTKGNVYFSATVKMVAVVGLLVLVFGCSGDQGLNPELKTNTAPDDSHALTDSERGVPASKLMFIELPQRNKGCSEGAEIELYDEKMITPKRGGVLRITYEPSDEVFIGSRLIVPEYAVSKKVLMSMTLETDCLVADVVFGPHGTVFEKPVTFIHRVCGLPLSAFAKDLGFYYYNEETGLWEEIPADIIYNTENECLRVETELDHFSWHSLQASPVVARYALAISR